MGWAGILCIHRSSGAIILDVQSLEERRELSVMMREWGLETVLWAYLQGGF
jgi:hypothetical protein